MQDLKSLHIYDYVVCYTDIDSCCTSNVGDHRGDWYWPNGTRVPFTSPILNIFYGREYKKVTMSIRRKSGFPTQANGIFHCHIDVSGFNNNPKSIGRKSAYIGLYSGGGGKVK